MSENRVVLLESTFFAGAKIDRPSLEELAAALEERRFAKGTAIFRQGDPAPDMYFVVSGRVLISKPVGDSRVPLAEIGPGGYFGEMALVDGGARSADADALEDVETLVLEDAEFDDLLDRAPRLGVFFLQATSKRLRALNTQVAPASRALSSEDTDPICIRYPFPIASVYRSMLVIQDPRPRLERFFDLLEVTLRYLGAIAVAQSLVSQYAPPALDDALARGLGALTLGQWMKVIQLVSQLGEGDPARLFAPELHGAAWGGAGNRSDALESLWSIVGFRNRMRHGAGGAQTDASAASMLDKQEPRMRAVLEAFAFIADYPLVWIEKMSFSRGTFNYRYQQCMGSHADFRSEGLVLKEPLETGHAYLLHKSRGSVLPLYPMVLVDACGVCAQREVFFLHKTDGEELEYIEFRRGHHTASAGPREVHQEILAANEARRTARADVSTASWDRLVGLLGAADPGTRRHAAILLARSKNRRATPALVQALGSAVAAGEHDVAAAVCNTLGQLQDKRALEPLVSAMKSAVTGHAIDALGFLGRREAAPVLHEALTSTERVRAARALARIGSPGAEHGTIVGSSALRDAAGNTRTFSAEDVRSGPLPAGAEVTFFPWASPAGPSAAHVKLTRAATEAAPEGAVASRGKVRWFDPAKQMGFLRDDDGGDVLVRAADVRAEGLRSRQAVRYLRVRTAKGWRAFEVRGADD